jgi:hypothetical protein
MACVNVLYHRNSFLIVIIKVVSKSSEKYVDVETWRIIRTETTLFSLKFSVTETSFFIYA